MAKGTRTVIKQLTIGLISKKASLHVQHTFFLYISLPLLFVWLQRGSSRNFLVTHFLEEMSYVFLFTFCFTSAHFHLATVAARIPHVVTSATKFSCCSSNKKIAPLFFFISHSRSLSPFLLVSFAGLLSTFSVFLLLYIPNLWTWQLI